ncbi:hypothetical protein AV540_26205 [Brevibacillus parabrevis]|uniref:hypothetical protein n=1 Tax=Brevibacillus parabrevis TaxID=54914 RepID=UPI0007AB9CC1|nr:hypothetical protein [Brevibacillus parabrevis]KZE55704.1 hypothetical protein AV540_26205 [Brevibacillus parabrevis]
MFYKGMELTCTQEELDKYVESIAVERAAYDFSEKYNGVEIENPTGNPNAKYYVLTVGGKTYLQNHNPFQPGFGAITSDNLGEIMARHEEVMLDGIIFETFAVRPSDKIAQLEQQLKMTQDALDALLLG